MHRLVCVYGVKMQSVVFTSSWWYILGSKTCLEPSLWLVCGSLWFSGRLLVAAPRQGNVVVE